MKKRCEPSMQIERGISRPSSIRHQSHLTLIVEIMPDRQHTMRAVPTGAGGSAPDVQQGALGGRRARLDVVTSGSGSGRAFPARPTELLPTSEIVQPFLMHPVPLRSEMFLKLLSTAADPY